VANGAGDPRTQIAAMQRNLKCVAQRWLYSSIHGAYDQVKAKIVPIHDPLLRGHRPRKVDGKKNLLSAL